MKVIVISGKQGAGKSTLAEELARQYQEKAGQFGPPAVVLKFADPIYGIQKVTYDYLSAYYGVAKLEKGEKDRTLLQLLGTDWGQKRFGTHVWSDMWKARLQHLQVGLVITDDMRFPHELQAASDIGAFTVRLICPESVRAQRIGNNFGGSTHPSETALDGVGNPAFKYIGWSDGTSAERMAADILERSGAFAELEYVVPA